MSETKIPWATHVWNPVTGCTKVSPGCANCYIERQPPMRMAGRKFVNGTTGVQLHPERLDQPLHWRKPRRIFVCSMADLFHEDVDGQFINQVWMTIRNASQHTFMLLTKRPERMLEWTRIAARAKAWPINEIWPPWAWVGVTIENARYTYRADILREIPAAVRFISAEPLLGSLLKSRDYLAETSDGPAAASLDLTGISWVIAGCESGPKRRPMELDWVRELRDACRGCAVYGSDGCDGSADRSLCRDCEGAEDRPAFFFKQQIVNGRKVECPKLDGRQWTEFPR